MDGGGVKDADDDNKYAMDAAEEDAVVCFLCFDFEDAGDVVVGAAGAGAGAGAVGAVKISGKRFPCATTRLRYVCASIVSQSSN